jgi:hypothetical protein
MALGKRKDTASFTPLIKYDARSGRFTRCDRTQAFDGWETTAVDITDDFEAVIDFESVETGWVCFTPGGAPDFRMVPLGGDIGDKAVERTQCKTSIKLCDEQIAAAERKLTAAQHRAVVAEGRAIEEEENVQNSEFGYFPPAPGMVLRTNATLHMSEVAKELELPSSLIRRGTVLRGRAAEVFMSARNAEKMLETRMVRYVRNPG